MTEPGIYRLELGKEDFKFSCAHFTLFAGGAAEPLHGHNYRVRVEVEGERLDPLGMLVDFAAVKRAVRALCARLDERVLLPELAPDLVWERCGEEGEEIEARFAGRRYVWPAAEVVLLPIANTSVELLAAWLWRELAPELVGYPVGRLAVAVEETLGQGCRYAAPLPG
jgi:6-pyruvoyltetrahydropterin/6-carboxytetrahydropterin synthase